MLLQITIKSYTIVEKQILSHQIYEVNNKA